MEPSNTTLQRLVSGVKGLHLEGSFLTIMILCLSSVFLGYVALLGSQFWKYDLGRLPEPRCCGVARLTGVRFMTSMVTGIDQFNKHIYVYARNVACPLQDSRLTKVAQKCTMILHISACTGAMQVHVCSYT